MRLKPDQIPYLQRERPTLIVETPKIVRTTPKIRRQQSQSNVESNSAKLQTGNEIGSTLSRSKMCRKFSNSNVESTSTGRQTGSQVTSPTEVVTMILPKIKVRRCSVALEKISLRFVKIVEKYFSNFPHYPEFLSYFIIRNFQLRIHDI